jgi:hypothetical protein
MNNIVNQALHILPAMLINEKDIVACNISNNVDRHNNQFGTTMRIKGRKNGLEYVYAYKNLTY